MKFIEKYEAQIHEDLHNWAAEHTNSHERLVLLPIDPTKYPHQRIMEHTVHSQPLEPIALDPLVAQIEPRYPEFIEAVEENPKSLRIAGAILNSRQNLIVGTDHQELIDIALLMAYLSSSLRQKGTSFSSGLIANKMAAYLGVEMEKNVVVPLTDVLGMAFDEVYLTLPASQSAKERLSLPRQFASRVNKTVVEKGIIMRLKTTRRLGKAMLLGAALTGTVNKELDESAYKPFGEIEYIPQKEIEHTQVLGRANIGVLAFMKNSLTMVAGTQLEKGNIKVTIADEPLYIDSKELLESAMQKIAIIRSEQDPSHYYVYDSVGNLPVKKSHANEQ